MAKVTSFPTNELEDRPEHGNVYHDHDCSRAVTEMASRGVVLTQAHHSPFLLKNE